VFLTKSGLLALARRVELATTFLCKSNLGLENVGGLVVRICDGQDFLRINSMQIPRKIFPMTLPLSLRHFFLALVVVAVWGTNFVVIKVALCDLPPLLFAALRFILVFLPAAVVFPRPSVSLWNLALYGILIGVGQFGLLYIARAI
jgi:hypothetical protein